MIHRLADCMSSNIGEDTNVWQFCVIFPKAVIGSHCNICANVLIENDVVIGDYCTVKSGVQLRKGASIGANSTVVAGVEIGEYAFIGAGSVVTKNIPPHTTWYGNPAIQRGYITKDGILLNMDKKDKEGNQYEL